MGSPPPAGSKKVVLKLRSVNNMVMAPAKTGKESNSRKAVMSTDHTKRGKVSKRIPGVLILKIVAIKLIAPIIEETPAQCRLKMTISTEPPEWVWGPDRGGYAVQPVPAPCSTKVEPIKRRRAGGNSQKLRLFSLGKAISGEPMYSGINQLPNPPIKTGITKKKIMTNA